MFKRTTSGSGDSTGCGCAIGTASCGNKDGAGAGAITDSDCGAGFVYDVDAARTQCDGNDSNRNACSMEFDHDKCCNPVTCGSKNGLNGDRITDDDCGDGYIRDGSAANTLCIGARGCDMTALSYDHSACCNRQATCGDTSGSGGPPITDADCSSARSGTVSDPAATARLCTYSDGAGCGVSASSMVDFSTCCTTAEPLARLASDSPPPPPPPPPPSLIVAWPPPPPPLQTNLRGTAQSQPSQQPPQQPPNEINAVDEMRDMQPSLSAASLLHHGFTPPKLRDTVDNDFTFSADALMDASSRFTFATEIDYSTVLTQLEAREISQSIQLVSSASKASSPVWVLTPSNMIDSSSDRYRVAGLSGKAGNQAPAPVLWGGVAGNRDRRKSLERGVLDASNFGETSSLLLTPDGKMFVLYVGRRTAEPGSEVAEMRLLELFTKTDSRTGLGEFVVRADVWGATTLRATVRADDAFKLAYTNHGVGNEHILIFNCDRDIPTVAINLRTYKGSSRLIPMLGPTDAGKDAYRGASQFTFIPEGIDHFGVTYDLLAVSSSGTSVHVFLASSTGNTGIVSTKVHALDGAPPTDEQFDLYSAPGTTVRPTHIYVSSAATFYALSWATMGRTRTMGTTFALAAVQEHIGIVAAGTQVCFAFVCPHGRVSDPKSALIDVPCLNGRCTEEQCCTLGGKVFPGLSPILTPEARVKIQQQLLKFRTAAEKAAKSPAASKPSSPEPQEAKPAKTEAVGTPVRSNKRSKTSSWPSSYAVTGGKRDSTPNNLNTIGAIVFGVMLGIVGAIVRGRRQTAVVEGEEQDPLMTMRIPSSRMDRRERTDQFPAMHVPEELEDCGAAEQHEPWYSVYRLGLASKSPNSRVLEGGSTSTPKQLKARSGRPVTPGVVSPSQADGGAILSPRTARSSRNTTSKCSPQRLQNSFVENL